MNTDDALRKAVEVLSTSGEHDLAMRTIRGADQLSRLVNAIEGYMRTEEYYEGRAAEARIRSIIAEYKREL